MTEKKPRAGGPKTNLGKAIASKNAVTHGVWRRWLDEGERAEHDRQCAAFLAEYDDGSATANMLVDELVTARMRLARIRDAEAAMYVKARLLKASIERQPHPNSVASTMPPGEEGHERAIELAAASAMPDGEALDRLERYATTSERTIFRCLQTLKVLKDERATTSHLVGRTTPASLVDLSAPAQLQQ